MDEADYERRKHRRVPFGHRAIVSPERKGMDNTPAVVMVRDVSVGGVSFLHDEAFKVGTPFVIEFKGHQDRPVKMHCSVVRCEAGGSGGAQFVVGAAYDALLTEELPAEKLSNVPKLVQLAPAEAKHAEPQHTEPKHAEPKPAAPIHAEVKHGESKPVEHPPAAADTALSAEEQARIAEWLKKPDETQPRAETPPRAAAPAPAAPRR